MLTIGIIIGSTRPGRKAEAVARWVHLAWNGALKPLRGRMGSDPILPEAG